MPSEMQTRDWLVPQTLKFSDLPCLPRQSLPGSSRTKPNHSASSLGHSGAQGPAAGRRGTPALWWPVCPPTKCLSTAVRASSALPGKEHLQQSPASVGSSLLGMPGCVHLAAVTRGGRWEGDTTLGFLPLRPQQAEHREAEQGRALCWHAAASAATTGTCWGGEMSTPSKVVEAVWALHSSTLLLLLQLVTRPKEFPGTKRQQRQLWFYLFRGKMYSVCSKPHGPHGAWSISHFYLPHDLLPMGDDSK